MDGNDLWLLLAFLFLVVIVLIVIVIGRRCATLIAEPLEEPVAVITNSNEDERGRTVNRSTTFCSNEICREKDFRRVTLQELTQNATEPIEGIQHSCRVDDNFNNDFAGITLNHFENRYHPEFSLRNILSV